MNSLLKEGLSDAIGFLVGALSGYLLAKILGFDLFATGYSNSSIVAILLVGLGGGLGLQASRKYLIKKDKK